MKKLIKVDQDVYSQLLAKKSEVIAIQGNNITFSELIGMLLKND